MNPSGHYDVVLAIDTCVDLALWGADVVPEFGQKEKLVDDYRLVMGGSNGIFACQAARLGLSVGAAGTVGDDAFGEVVLSGLRDAGVDVSHMTVDAAARTGLGVALVAGADRAIVTVAGTIDALDADSFPRGLLARPRHVHVGSYFLMPRLQRGYPALLAAAKQRGATVSVDTNWDPSERWDNVSEVLALADVLLPNENEALALTGQRTVADALAQLGELAPVVAIKRGAHGAVVLGDGETTDVPALAVEVADTIGAGDAFDAGFVAGFLAGLTPVECARMGCACGSLSTRAVGGVAGLPNRAEVEEHLRATSRGLRPISGTKEVRVLRGRGSPR